MRLAAIILSFIIVFLSVMPCTDRITCEQESESIAHHDHSDDQTDTCSPFCICACCGSISLEMPFIENPFRLERQEMMVSKQDVPNNPNFTSSHFFSIWQPPKI
ncbi:MAG: hypothetical protein H7329_14865 [Opitutaceae bacterium]|nr:hypothetical protein [Cytophagales bacterium]